MAIDAELANYLNEQDKYEAREQAREALIEDLAYAARQGAHMNTLIEWSAQCGEDLLCRLHDRIRRVSVWADPEREIRSLLIQEWQAMCQDWAKDEADLLIAEEARCNYTTDA